MDIFVGTQQQTTSAQHMPVRDLQALISVNPFAHSILFSLFVQFNSGRSQYRFWLIFGSPPDARDLFPNRDEYVCLPLQKSRNSEPVPFLGVCRFHICLSFSSLTSTAMIN